MHPGKRLREERLRRHLSQEALATELGVSTLSISRWERGETMPQSYFRLQLSNFFGIDPEEIFPTLNRQEQSPQPTFWIMPRGRNPYFIGRDGVLEQCYTLLHTSQHRLPVAFTGLAGCGKTQAAVEFAYRYAQDYNAIFWVEAGTPGALLAGLVSLAQFLQLPGIQDQDDLHIIQAVMQWLRTNKRWLLIFDAIEDLVSLSHINLPTENGHVLVTTRSQFTGTLALSINLHILMEADAMLFLLHRAKLLTTSQSLEEASEMSVQLARRICSTLGNLPLALDQAGAYIEESGCDLFTYLSRYEQHHIHLLKRRGLLGKDHPESVANTFLLLYDQVHQRYPLAAKVLCLCAFLYQSDVPERIIQTALPFLKNDLTSATTASDTDEIFVILRDLSLIYRHIREQTFCVHNLVQVVLRKSMEPSEEKQWIGRTIHIVNAALPTEALFSGPSYDIYIPHVQTCLEFIEQATIAMPEAVDLLEKSGNYLAGRGRSNEARRMLSHALSIQQDLYGTASSMYVSIAEKLARLSEKSGEKSGIDLF